LSHAAFQVSRIAAQSEQTQGSGTQCGVPHADASLVVQCGTTSSMQAGRASEALSDAKDEAKDNKDAAGAVAKEKHEENKAVAKDSTEKAMGAAAVKGEEAKEDAKEKKNVAASAH
jgi:hypothetical protein